MGVTHKIKPPVLRKYLFESLGSFDELGICLLFDGCENAAGVTQRRRRLRRRRQRWRSSKVGQTDVLRTQSLEVGESQVLYI